MRFGRILRADRTPVNPPEPSRLVPLTPRRCPEDFVTTPRRHMLVVGYGHMGRNHARVLRDLGHDVQTLDPADVGADHRMISFDLIAWTETVCVATPIDLLARTAETWLKRGKHVLVEKPGATDALTLRYLHALAYEQRVDFAVGYTERHNGAVHALADALPRIGTLRHVGMRRLGYAALGSDPLLDLACHDLDFLDALGVDADVRHASSAHGHATASLVADRDGPEEVTVSIEVSHLHPVKTRTVEAVGSDGVLHVDLQRRVVSIHQRNEQGDHGGTLPVDQTEPLVTEWRSFLATGDGSDGIRALEQVERCRSFGTSQPSETVAVAF